MVASISKFKAKFVEFGNIFLMVMATSSFCFFSDLPLAFSSTEPHQRAYWPTQGWQISTPEEQGLDSDILYDVDNDIQSRYPDIYSLLVIKNGRLVFEKYYSYGDQEMIAPVYSVTKSVMSILIGIAIDQNRITSVDQKVSDFFPELFTQEIDPAKKDISIRHLLSMTPGFVWEDRGEISWEWFFSSDFIKFTFNLDLETPPGKNFKYSTAVSHILSGILTRATGMTALAFAEKYLFTPLGIKDVEWKRGPKGFTRGGTGLKLSARDMAKIGLLYLNNGIWEGEPIVSESWVKASTRFQVDAEYVYGYGYQWWTKAINGCPSYRAWGRGGQFIVVAPDLDLVIAVTSKFAFPLAPTFHYSPLFEDIASAVQDIKCTMTVKYEKGSDTLMVADDSHRCRHLVNVPEGVSRFLDGYAKSFKNKNIKKSMTYYSDAFLLDGRDKEGSRKMLGSLFSQIPVNSICIQLSEFRRNGAIADVAGTLHLNSRSTTLIIPKIIEENGQWKWYGDQRSNTDTRLAVPAEVTRFLAEYCAAILTHDETEMAEFFSDHFSSRGFTKESYLSYAIPMYMDLTSVEIDLTDYGQKGNLARVDGLFKTNPYGTTPLMFNRIIRENGKWKWAGTKSTSEH